MVVGVLEVPTNQALLKREPWRGEVYEDEPKFTCSGKYLYDGTAYWQCTACGRVGTSTYELHPTTPRHRAERGCDVR